jgi:uncharacterized protein (DUF433 family)
MAKKKTLNIEKSKPKESARARRLKSDNSALRNGNKGRNGAATASNRIVVTRGVCGGRPRIAGTRIPVAVILRCREIGFSDERILKGYPALTAEDLSAAWAFDSSIVPLPLATTLRR